MPSPSSATFRSLINRWRVSDEQALELISYKGKLPTTDRPPRFRLLAEQVRILLTMLEIDSALVAAGINCADAGVDYETAVAAGYLLHRPPSPRTMTNCH